MSDSVIEPKNLLIPFCRDAKRDFATAGGPTLLQSKIRQILLTEGATPYGPGELPWRTNFGSALPRLRHRNNDETLAELARVYVRDALAHWLPGVRLVGLDVEQQETSPILRLRVRDGRTSASVEVPLSI